MSHVLNGSVTVSFSKIWKSCIICLTLIQVFLKGLVETCNAYTVLIFFTWYENIFHVLTKVGDVGTLYSVGTKCSYVVLLIYIYVEFIFRIKTQLKMYISNKIVGCENYNSPPGFAKFDLLKDIYWKTVICLRDLL